MMLMIRRLSPFVFCLLSFDAGFDVKLWERINIVKRTEEEERAAIN